jgi:hypothetical protein
MHHQRFLILPLALLASTWVSAQSIPASASFDKFMWTATGGSAQTVGFSTTGQPLLNSGVPTIDLDGGLPRATATGSITNPSGRFVPVTATGRIPAAEVGKAVGRALSKVVTPLVIGVALYDLAKELGFTLNNSTGAVSVTKSDPSVCTAAPCYVYVVTNYENTLPWRSSPSQSCQDFKTFDRGSNPDFSIVWNGNLTCVMSRVGGSDSYHNLSRNQVAPSPAVATPSTQTEFLNAVAAKSGWPSSSNVAKVLADPAYADPSVKIKTEPMTVTGPATSVGTSTTTNNTTNNTTKTDTTTYNHSYSGPNVTTTNNVSSVTVNNSTGAITNSETTTSEPVPKTEPKEVEVCGLPGKPACLIDETGTPKDKAVSFEPSNTELDKVRTDSESEIGKAATISAPSWSFSFQLPTGCAPYVTGLRGFIMNVCPYQSIMHDLLSMIWAAATAFACIGMVGRTIREA